MKQHFFSRFLFVALLFFSIGVSPVFAVDQQGGGTMQQGGGTVSTPPNASTGFQLTPPLNVNSICGLVQKILGFALAIGMPIAALFLAWVGFSFIWAKGNPGNLKTAKKNLFNVFIGIFIFMAAWLLGQVIANTLRSIANQTSSAALNSCN